MSKPLLGTRAELAAEPGALFVRRLDDPAPRCLHLLDACAHLSLKPHVLDREPGR